MSMSPLRPGKLQRATAAAPPSVLSTGVRPFRVQRDDDEAGPSAKAEDDSAGMLDAYLNKRQIARTVPPAGAEGAAQEPEST